MNECIQNKIPFFCVLHFLNCACWDCLKEGKVNEDEKPTRRDQKEKEAETRKKPEIKPPRRDLFLPPHGQFQA